LVSLEILKFPKQHFYKLVALKIPQARLINTNGNYMIGTLK